MKTIAIAFPLPLQSWPQAIVGKVDKESVLVFAKLEKRAKPVHTVIELVPLVAP